MKVSGLTILRNVVKMDYPFREAIRSALPLCDEFVVVVGQSDDNTLQAVKDLNDSRIKIIETVWSDKVTPRKCLLSQQTNIGLHMCQGDWVVYVQANEILHEASLPNLRSLMEQHQDDTRVEALLLERLTLWGDYNHVLAVYPERFKFSPRIVRPYIGTFSIRDAMSFAVFDGFSTRGRYPTALDTGEYVYRYGFVCTPAQYGRTAATAVHKKKTGNAAYQGEDLFYTAVPRNFVRKFTGRNPAVLEDRMHAAGLSLSLDDPRWRTRSTMKEHWRAMETRFYESFGVPRFRNTRYRLIGTYKDKPSVLES